jgi:predicted CoA-substrate-specific enzyme activase
VFKPRESQRYVLIGLDVGSTTVKAVVVDRESREILWKDYQKHETHQPEKSLEFMTRIEEETGLAPDRMAVFCTGSGAGPIAQLLGARFVQEVNAVSLAVRRLFPSARSVVELGGQDAKIIVFKEDPRTGALTTIPSMNDKCASGTGATIEKVARKVGVQIEQLGGMEYLAHKDNLVHIAAKCGVFAETDVVGHLKAGLPEDQIMASLFDSIVSQNLSVLTRGNTLRPDVLLLGGPNTYIKGLIEAWRYAIPRMWAERNVEMPDRPLEESIIVPENAQYYAAIGSVEFALQEGDELIAAMEYRGTAPLRKYIQVDRELEKAQAGGAGLWETREELDAFLMEYTKPPFIPTRFHRGQVVSAYLGIDGGSTSTKAVIIDEHGHVMAKSYTLSQGNPIQDTMDCVSEIRSYVESFGATLHVRCVGTTGYAKDILAEILRADAPIVETVAHTMAARKVYRNVDVIVDVGGQDIKIIMLKDGRVSDFRLNTQCSAGNGYFLQSTAQTFNVPVEKYAEVAFGAQRMPSFGYGCAVFMQSDIVNFQKEGWTPPEIMAGLANVLPKNVWLYVSKIPNLASLGTNFVLQGGTQYNLAAVKSQVDFIRKRFEGKGVEPNVVVHDHCGEAGAIGAALEALRMAQAGHQTTFIGLDEIGGIVYRKTNDERTRCHFCKNKCSRTFVDVQAAQSDRPHYDSKVPLDEGWQRIITGFSCDRGTVESLEAMRVIKAAMDLRMGANPNTVDEMGSGAFRPVEVEPALPAEKGWIRSRVESRRLDRERRRAAREKVRIGMPRVLNMYSHAPFFMGYFQALGLKTENLVFSQVTNESMYKEGAKRGSVDPCFPSKIGIPHVHDLIFRLHRKKPLDAIFFPMIDSFPTFLTDVNASRACPTVVITPEAVKAAFIKESDLFAENGLRYLNPLINLDKPPLLRRQMFDSLAGLLSLDPLENDVAVVEGLKALEAFTDEAQVRGREIIRMLEAEQRLGFVLLARPYHNDEGLNHEILIKLQRLGYPVLAQDSLPVDREFLDPLFERDLEAGVVKDPRDVKDVWVTPYSENTSRKAWAAKIAARHPNLVALELSSFKCGLDAPAYTIVERIISTSQTPFFTFRDLDENDPGGAIRIRLETMDYFLKREREKLLTRRPGGEVAGAVEISELAQLDTSVVNVERPERPACASGGKVRPREEQGPELVQILTRGEREKGLARIA